jgi:hypothetical protein
VVSKEEHLGAFREIADNVQRSRRSRVITVNQEIVKDDRARRNRLYMVFNGRQAQSEVQLIPRAIAQSLDLHLFLVLSNRDQDGLVIISKTGS